MRKTGGASSAGPPSTSSLLPSFVESSQNLTLRKKASVWLLSCAVVSPSLRYLLAIIVSPLGDKTKKFDIMLAKVAIPFKDCIDWVGVVFVD